MKPWYREDVHFEAVVAEVRGGSGSCRCGHEPGDSYTMAYGTPKGLCGELYHRLFPMLEVLRAGGDVSALEPAGSRDEVLVWCPSRVVRLSVRARRD